MTSARAPHMLYVVWGYPPCRGGGVYRALATANRFAEQGWRVTVLTAERDTFERFTGADPGLEDRVDPRIHVERIPFEWPLQDTDLRTWSRLRVNQPRLWRKYRVAADQVPFPEVGYGPWRKPLEKAAERIHRDDPVDLVVATANPHVTFAAAYALHRRYGIPYVMDYRDAWLLDVFTGDRLHDEKSRAARWEGRLIESAREVWFVNEPIRRWHADLYPQQADRMHVVANGYDEDLAPEARSHHAPNSPLVFGYIGTVSPKVPLQEFSDGWRQARVQEPALQGARAQIHGYLGYYATPRADLMAIVAQAAEVGVSYEGPVSKTEIRRVYDSFDALLLILGTGRYVTSGKVFECIASGLPIVSVHDPDNAASDVLRGYPLWFPARELSEAGIADALSAAARAAARPDPALWDAAAQFAHQYRRDLQLDPRIETLGIGVGK